MEPDCAENIPLAHLEQTTLALVSAYVPAWHAAQLDWPDVLKVPTAQSEQLTAVNAVAYRPASQGTHKVAPLLAFV